MIVMITIVCNSFPNLFFGKNFKKFMVKPLSKRSIFSCKLYDLLSNYASPKGTAWGNLSFSIKSNILDKFLID